MAAAAAALEGVKAAEAKANEYEGKEDQLLFNKAKGPSNIVA